jgi:hypothetical protein
LRGAILFLSLSAVPVMAQEISPAQAQEYENARDAVEAAQKVNSEIYAPEAMKRAHDLLAAAEGARVLKDGDKCAHVSRLARAQAELAKAVAELRGEEEKLNTANEELQKARLELQRVKKSQ